VLTRKKLIYQITIFAILFFAALLLAPLIGSTDIDVNRALNREIPYSENTDAQILLSLRLARVLMAALTGGTLALAGLVFQALLRNALATPFTLGVSSGAALGAVLAMKVDFIFHIAGFSSITISAFLGALLSIIIVFSITRLKSGGFSTYTLILSGVSISFFFSAIILFIHYLADFTETHQMIRWIMGGVNIVNYNEIIHISPFAMMGFVVMISLSRQFNLTSLGEESAMAKGVNVNRVQKTGFIVASLLTGLVVAHSGPIGFIGLMVPHILRLIVGADHRLLVPISILFGGTFLIICDTLARTVIAPAEIPVGIITALCGGPFFIWLIFKKRNELF
jgi:iron complex transport system permease protein